MRLGLQFKALNSSMVLDETTEEGRLLQTGIVLGKKKSGHQYMQTVMYCDARVCLRLGAGVRYFVFIKRHCTRVYLVKEG